MTCACGCGGEVNPGCRYIYQHHSLISPVRHIVNPETGCWEWQRGQDGRGYGVMYLDGVRWKAHRLYFTLAYGHYPDGLEIHHACRNRGCVNPGHLQALTPTAHRTDMTPAIARTIRESKARGVDIAARYGISKQIVCDIRKGRRWADA